MIHKKIVLAILAAAVSATAVQTTQAQQIVRGYGRAYAGNEIFLGMAHVDGPVDHDNIKVERYAGRFNWVILRVAYAPIQFDRVVIHYADGEAEVLPVYATIPMGGSSQWIQLPGGERRIRSLELWYARAQPEVPVKPEVQLFGRP
jgi:hypothetical protein